MGWQSTLDAAVLADQMVLLGVATSALQQQQLTDGVPPGVPGVKSATATGVGPTSGDTVFTFTAAGRVWGVCLSGSVSANSSYAAGNSRVYYLAQIDGSTQLAVIEQSISAPEQNASDVIYVPFGGIPAAQGTPLELVVNGGTSITDAEILASAVFFYSIP